MMRSITLNLDIFRGEADRQRSQRTLLWMLEALVNANREYLRMFPTTPQLYRAGVKYIRETGTEDWQAIPAVIRSGGGDCEDLAAWRVAEQREAKVKCRPYIRWRKFDDFYLYHVLVQYGPDEIEDPSKKLGMGREEETPKAVASHPHMIIGVERKILRRKRLLKRKARHEMTPAEHHEERVIRQAASRRIQEAPAPIQPIPEDIQEQDIDESDYESED